MDQELIAYLDKRFQQTAELITEKIAGLQEDTTGQIGGLREEVGGLKEEVGGLREEVGGLREEMDRRFEQAEERDRHILVVTEGLRHEVHLLAEAYLGMNDRLKTFQSEKMTFEHFTLWMAPYFRNLDLRVEALEDRAAREHMDVMDAIRESLNKPPFKPSIPTD